MDVKKRVVFVWRVKLSSKGDHAFMFVVSSQMVVVRIVSELQNISHVKPGCSVCLVAEED